jgi:hypothetical protein
LSASRQQPSALTPPNLSASVPDPGRAPSGASWLTGLCRT